MPNDINTKFCCELLRLARRDARAYNVRIPRKLTALRVTGSRDQWFVQGMNDSGEYVTGDNAYHARASYIDRLIRRVHPQLEEN